MHSNGQLRTERYEDTERGCQKPAVQQKMDTARKRGVIFRLDALALSVIATATSLAGWVAVTLRYCIKTAKPIGKLFRPSESPIILVF